MNPAELHQKLIAAARRDVPSDRVPYAFEKRITALLQRQPAPDRWALWARALWRSAVACLLVMLLLGAFSLLSPTPVSASGELSEEFESTMLAGMTQDADFAQ